jgi:hypothetical protein
MLIVWVAILLIVQQSYGLGVEAVKEPFEPRLGVTLVRTPSLALEGARLIIIIIITLHYAHHHYAQQRSLDSPGLTWTLLIAPSITVCSPICSRCQH